MNKFNIVYENIIDQIQKSYVDYKLTGQWIKDVKNNIAKMSKQETKNYIQTLQNDPELDLGKKQALKQLIKQI